MSYCCSWIKQHLSACMLGLASRRANAMRTRVVSCTNFTQVTVVNPLFLKLMQQYKPTGIISTLAQEVFADIKVSGRINVEPRQTLATVARYCSMGLSTYCSPIPVWRCSPAIGHRSLAQNQSNIADCDRHLLPPYPPAILESIHFPAYLDPIPGRHDCRVCTGYKSLHSANGARRRLPLSKGFLNSGCHLAHNIFYHIYIQRHSHGCVHPPRQLRWLVDRLSGLSTDGVLEQLSMGSAVVHRERGELSRS